MPVLETDSRSAVHFDARAAWNYEHLNDLLKTELKAAIISGGQISLTWPESEGEETQTILLKSEGGKYVGSSIWASGKPLERRSTVTAVLYSNDFGHVLVGEEKWTTGDIDWFVVQLSNPRSA